MTVFFGKLYQLLSTTFFDLVFRQKILSKKAVLKWCRILLTKIADEKNCRIIIRQQFFSTTFFDIKQRHSTKFLRFFVKICRKTLSMTVFFDNKFRQHFSHCMDFMSKKIVELKFDSIFRQHFSHWISNAVEICRRMTKNAVESTAFFDIIRQRSWCRML